VSELNLSLHIWDYHKGINGCAQNTLCEVCGEKIGKNPHYYYLPGPSRFLHATIECTVVAQLED